MLHNPLMMVFNVCSMMVHFYPSVPCSVAGGKFFLQVHVSIYACMPYLTLLQGGKCLLPNAEAVSLRPSVQPWCNRACMHPEHCWYDILKTIRQIFTRLTALIHFESKMNTSRLLTWHIYCIPSLCCTNVMNNNKKKTNNSHSCSSLLLGVHYG